MKGENQLMFHDKYKSPKLIFVPKEQALQVTGHEEPC